ncbi:alpha/beta hydrolase [Loigolactobacillus backii]|uniref:alpha/beta hydrolase n=1 Tax=Loigolactobacillus backii TaxID=375175 RepID=UPI0022FD5206|nr:alpha/beta hydrolase [Loigolactobacillus backii]MDA5386716.1 alpha/beta hydrolase [Loigolactobacillus backii]MDA5389241.1 alpha/beta hydrolase [Loigolactobacillus backii]
MRHLRWFFLLVILLLLPATTSHAAVKSSYATPTLFVHGYHGGLNSLGPLIDRAELERKGRRVLIAEITPQKIQFIGRWPKSVKHPIIQVIFQNNQANWNLDAQWLNRLLTILKEKYNLKNYNAVGHSRGSLALVIANEHQPALKLKRLVVIAGSFDGALWRDDHVNENHFLASGRPAIIHPEYQEILNHRTQFPKQTRVLAIAGNRLDGTNSDGVVSLISALSLRYALGKQVKEYRQKIFYGKNTEHSQLPRFNQSVQQTTIDFIWPS